MPRGRPPGSVNNKLHQNPNQPRSKQTSYGFFVQLCRQEYRKKHPDEVMNIQFADFNKKCAERWKTMSDKEKRRFNQMAEEDKKRYEMEMASFAAAGASIGPNGGFDSGEVKIPGKRGPKTKKKKRLKDPNAPKRCMSGFFWFSQDERVKVKGANPDFGVGEISKELGRRWSEANEAVRAKYEAMAVKDRERYLKEKQSYQTKLKEAAKNGASKGDRLQPFPVPGGSVTRPPDNDLEDDLVEDEEDEDIIEEDEGDSD